MHHNTFEKNTIENNDLCRYSFWV